MTEVQQIASPWPVIGAAITVAGSVLLFVASNWWNGNRKRLTRSRRVFSKAYAAVQEYKEFPYVIRRRRASAPEDERVRISSELQKIQADLAFYSAWLTIESHHVHRRFSEFLEQVRLEAGVAMHDAWLEPAAEDDSGMNMLKLDMSAIAPFETAYLEEVADHLALRPRWVCRMFRRKTKE